MSFSRRSSRSRPTNGGSSPALRPTPRRAADTRTARHSATGSGLPLSSKLPAGSHTIAASVMRRVASSTSTVPGAAAPWIRDAVFTRSPATIPWPTAPTVTAASPVATAARACEVDAGALAQGVHGVDELERHPHGPLGVVLLRDGRPPHGHDGVADELLDRAAVALDRPAGGVEVAGQKLAHLLGSRRPERAVNPTRSAKSTDTIRRSVVGGGAARRGPERRRRSSRRTGRQARSRRRTRGRRATSSAPHWAQ